ncbi:MAG: fibronectin type III domain-containing protein [Gemmataceae bacterium]|nr:fibronectin type III domain-containing protein [Gemmataceae bacterium]
MRQTTYLLLVASCVAVCGTGAAGGPAKAVIDWANHPEHTWVKQSPRPGAPAPNFGWEGSGSYDPHSKKWIHQGGHDGIPQGFHLFTFDLDTGKWEQRFPDTSPPGSCCVDGGNVFDIANRVFVRFPGASLGHGWQWSRGVKLKSSHVWLYDPAANSWTNMRPPPYGEAARYSRLVLGSLNPAAAYDGNHELALSFGGQSSGGGTNNLFVYDAYANRLERLDSANPPSQRDGMGLTYDTTNDCLVMFGSQYASDEKTWLYRYRTNRWEGLDLDPHPPGKKGPTYSTIPRMAFDSLNHVSLCVTWDDRSNKHQTWSFDSAKKQWTKMNPPAEPSPSMSRSRNLAFSPEHNVFILELSAKEGRGSAPEIWTYRYKKAQPDRRPAPPSDLIVVTDSGGTRLTWKASPTAGERGYRVLRAVMDRPWQAEFKDIGTTEDTTFDDKGLKPGAVHSYKVQALGADGKDSSPSFSARTQPRVLRGPVVSVLAKDRVEVTWNAHPAKDIAGYNVYRGLVSVRTVKSGTPKPWTDNDPEYPEPLVVSVKDITGIVKLNAEPLKGTSFGDTKVDLTRKGPEADGHRYAVHAYLVKAVNRLGTESGPSPYALTVPSAPSHVLLREQGGKADLKWAANPEKGIAGYRLYRKGKGGFDIVRLTEELVKEARYLDGQPGGRTRYWVVAVDALGQEGEPSSPVWYGQSYKGFYAGEWHQ